MGGESQPHGRNAPQSDLLGRRGFCESCGESPQLHHRSQCRNPNQARPIPPSRRPSPHRQQSHVHVSLLDDPVMWGFKGFPSTDADLGRWVLAAEDICFKNRVLSYCFRLGKCIPITRGAGIYQEHMNEAIERLSDGAWLHTFPEGKVSQENEPIRRLKWGTASLIARAPVTPIVLPIVHHGFQEVMPENYLFGRRPPFPLFNKKITITVGDPIEFDLPKMSEMALTMSKDCSSSSSGWPNTTRFGLNEAAQKFLYSSISKQIWLVMENLRKLGKTVLK